MEVLVAQAYSKLKNLKVLGCNFLYTKVKKKNWSASTFSAFLDTLRLLLFEGQNPNGR